MYCRFRRVALVLIAAGTLYSCAKPPSSWRVAVLRFENLTPGADTDWIGRAISEEIAGQLEGTRHNAVIPFATLHQFDAALGARPITAPGVSAERPAAIGAGANRLLTGFYSVRGKQLTITAVQEDIESRQLKRPYIASGSVDDFLHLTDMLAHNIDEEATPAITGSARAMRSYAIGMESPPEQAKALLHEAVRLDPDFGKPYVALARMALAAKETDEFGRIFAAVRGRGNGVREVDRAVLNLEDARLHATLATRIDALAALVSLMPADPFRLQDLGTAELEANRYVEAADHYRKLTGLLPASTEPLNLLGYALMYSGDEAAALKAFERYRHAAPGDANAIDSTGDAEFFFGHFEEAATSYLQAHDKDPALAEGGSLLKAAWARLMRGDRKGAAALVSRYRDERGKLRDGLADFRGAQVLRAMGNREEAERLMTAYAASDATQVRQTAAAQLEWWRFLDGSGKAPSQASPNGQALLAVARKDYQAAVPLWRKLAEEASPTEWWTRSVYARVLAETGQTQESARYLKFTPTPQPSRGLSFDELWYPWILAARNQAASKIK